MGDDDIPDFLRGVVGLDDSAPAKVAEPAPPKLPQPTTADDDDVPDFLKGALGADPQPAATHYDGYGHQDYD